VHPTVLTELTGQRIADYRKAASASHRRAASRAPRRTVRYRAGWTLVALGLRLAAAPSRG